MILFPAIDLMNHVCVRLEQGRAGTETVYSDNPAEMARHWEACGAEYLHVVDLDAALENKGHNLDQAAAIAEAISIPVELGGGIRDGKKIEQVLDAGIARVILGTKACEKGFLKEMLTEFGDKIVVGIDARDGFVAVRGWVEVTKLNALDFAQDVVEMGTKTIIFTDIATDGMMTGPNIPAIEKLLDTVDADIIASGGVSRIQDIENLKPLESKGLAGAIIGKALYSGAIDLKEALKVAK